MAQKDANKLAMSRALGAAFLTHQVEQLEKSVGTASGNWRDRRSQSQGNVKESGYHARGPIQSSPKRNGGHNASVGPTGRNHREDKDKVADVVIVDASVLVHALNQVKLWSRPERKELVVVPLEALNTLDLLKKGTTQLAQRARAASRILEAQVGTNPRIVVQRDEDFVLWDKMEFKDAPASAFSDPHVTAGQISHPKNAPEWVRSTICCAKFESERCGESDQKRKVLFAVVTGPPTLPSSRTDKVDPAELNPVPLPPPLVNKHEPRSSGTLISIWAHRASLNVLELKATPYSVTSNTIEDISGTARKLSGGSQRRKTSSPAKNTGTPGLVERPPAVKAMMQMVAQPSKVVRVLARGEKLDPDT